MAELAATEDVLLGLKRALDLRLVGRSDAPDVNVIFAEPDDPYLDRYPYLVLRPWRQVTAREFTEAGRGNPPGRGDAYVFDYFQEPSTLLSVTKLELSRQVWRDMDDAVRAFPHDTPYGAGGPSDLWGLVLWAGEHIEVEYLRDYALKAGTVVRTATGVLYVAKQFAQ